MQQHDKVNILLVDDQPAKLLSYEVVLRDLDENLIKASSATDALAQLLKNDIAVVLVDVCMPDLDGFELAAMIRNHPRFQRTAIIFISAVLLADSDYLRGYEMGAVDYVPVPVVPELLRAKVRVFAELYRKTRDLESLNAELESRVHERTSALEAAAARLKESERRRNLALVAGQMGSWDWDMTNGDWMWDEGQCRIFGVDPASFKVSLASVRPLVAPEDFGRLKETIARFANGDAQPFQTEFKIFRPDGEERWCYGTAVPSVDEHGKLLRVSGVTVDITERKQAEDRQMLLAREVDHRARNALAVVQAIVRLTRESTQQAYVQAVEGRIQALAQAHTLLSNSRWRGADIARLVDEELAPYRHKNEGRLKVEGPSMLLAPEKAQNLALALHELATNSAKYGALSAASGRLEVSWQNMRGNLILQWRESGGPTVVPPTTQGFGTKIMNASIKHQLGGNVLMDWQPTGLHCTLQILNDPSALDVSKSARSENLVPFPAGGKRRVLLVEDEALVGMMMRDILVENGLFVVGPCCTLAEALATISATEVDCAILDLNLGGETVYPLAEVLSARSVPFLFVTGYGRESIEERFKIVPIIHKPVVRDSLERHLRDVLGVEMAAQQVPHVAPGGRDQSPPASAQSTK